MALLGKTDGDLDAGEPSPEASDAGHDSVCSLVEPAPVIVVNPKMQNTTSNWDYSMD